ncbi:MAG: nucleotide exchange factor GrpE [Clostridia bacterium]|nr:nucleotide exchange factor GrpE [Clostridia bacterium]
MNNEDIKEELNENDPEQNDTQEAKHDKKDRHEKKAEKKNAELHSALIAKEEELKKAKAALDESEDKYLRVCAEYDNYRKRASKEKEACFGDAYSDAVSAFLPLIDNIDRACEYACDDSNLSKGVLMMKKQLDDIMQKIGVTEIKSDGEQFDPEKHNAIMHEEDDSGEENVVVQTLQKGYELKGKVIRHAMVKVLN